MTPLYRAPEIFLNETEYSSAIDIWALGCIFAELVIKVPLFEGFNELDVLIKIFTLIGKPLNKYSSKLENIKIDYKPKEWKEIFPSLDEAGLDLISKMLVIDPEKRITASEALKHEFFL